jgi:TRAP-type C4-dicarboxylate transport system permease small subunit
MNFAKKISGWILAALFVALAIFPDWFGGEYFRFSVLLAALGTLMLWVSIVLLFSWLLSACGSLTRLVRENHRRSSVRWRRDEASRVALPIT